MTLPDAASLATPVGSGAIGTACETPETPATSTVATAIAHAVRIIVSSLARMKFIKNIIRLRDDSSAPRRLSSLMNE